MTKREGPSTRELRPVVEKVVERLLETKGSFTIDDIVEETGRVSRFYASILRDLGRAGVITHQAYTTTKRKGYTQQVPVWIRGNGTSNGSAPVERPKKDRHGNRICLDCGVKLKVRANDSHTVRCEKCKLLVRKDERMEQRIKASGQAILEGKCIVSSSRSFPTRLEELVRSQIVSFYKETEPDMLPSLRGRISREAAEICGALRDEIARLRKRVKHELRLQEEDAALLRKGERRRALEVLGLKADASMNEIRKTYRRLAREQHPDHGGSAEAMAELNAAWKVLEDRSN